MRIADSRFYRSIQTGLLGLIALTIWTGRDRDDRQRPAPVEVVVRTEPSEHRERSVPPPPSQPPELSDPEPKRDVLVLAAAAEEGELDAREPLPEPDVEAAPIEAPVESAAVEAEPDAQIPPPEPGDVALPDERRPALPFEPLPGRSLFAPPPGAQFPIPPQPQPLQPPPARLPGALPGGGERLSLRVDDQSLRSALELLGSQAAVNVVVSPGVQGTISVNLQDVTFAEALDVILKMGDLAADREGDIVFVYTAEEMAAIRQRARTMDVRVYHLNYIRAFDFAAMVQPFLSQEGTLSVTPPSSQGLGSSTAAGMSGGGGMGGGGAGGGSGGMGGAGGGGAGALSSGNTVAAGGPIGVSDTGGNSLSIGDMVVVRDYPEVLAEVDRMAERVDIQPLQVLIEAVILQVQLTDSQELGVNFSVIDNLERLALVTGSAAAINAAGGFAPARVLSAASPVAPFVDPRVAQLGPGFVAAPDQGLRFGFVADNVSGFIRAIELLNKVNVLASPRVLVLNKQRAEIQLGRRLGFRNTVTNLTSSLQTVQFLSVGTLLALRPYVSNDGMIRLEIHPEKSSGVIDAAGVPQTNTSELTTNILVPDGATIVIGGLMDNSDQIDEQGVLGLSRLPIIGPLFRYRLGQTNKTELIVLLTPRILNQGSLPGPAPGMPPKGESGVPNSGPMPGPPLPPALADRVSQIPTEDEPGRIGGDSADAPPPGEAPEVQAREDSQTHPVGILAPRPEPSRGREIRPPWPIARASPRTGRAGGPDTPPRRASAADAERDHDGYRPGDLTRSAFRRLGQILPHRRDDPTATAVEVAARAQPAARELGPRPALSGPGASLHVVRPGEDLGSIALRYYGSASLRSALWAANRDLVPSPERLIPGTTLRVPPAAQIERVVFEAVRDDPHAARPATPRRGLFGSFRRR